MVCSGILYFEFKTQKNTACILHKVFKHFHKKYVKYYLKYFLDAVFWKVF